MKPQTCCFLTKLFALQLVYFPFLLLFYLHPDLETLKRGFTCNFTYLVLSSRIGIPYSQFLSPELPLLSYSSTLGPQSLFKYSLQRILNSIPAFFLKSFLRPQKAFRNQKTLIEVFLLGKTSQKQRKRAYLRKDSDFA